MGKARTDIGPVSIISCGEYSSTAKYEKLSVVSFEGSSYIAKVANEGVPVTNTEVWHLIAEHGKSAYEVAVENGYEGTEEEWTNEHLSPEGYYNKNTIDNKFNNESNSRVNADAILQSQINGLASGSPLVASSVSEMTDTSHVYVNTTDGHWYWHDGTAWTDGGVYQATGIADGSTNKLKIATQVKEEYDSINQVIFNFPDNLKKDVAYIPSFERVAVSNTGVVTDSTVRLSTNFIPTGQGIYFEKPDGDTDSCFVRCFDKNYEYLTTVYVNASGTVNESGTATPNSIPIDNIYKFNNNIAFVRLVFRNAENSEITSINWSYSKKYINKALDSHFSQLSSTCDIIFEYGIIKQETGVDNAYYLTQYARTPFYYEIVPKMDIEFDIENQNIRLFEYDKDFNYIQYQNISSSKATPSPTTKYIRIALASSTSEIIETVINKTYNVKGISTKIKRNYTINAKVTDSQKLWYKVKGTEYYTSCMFKLPSNYTVFGKPVPIIIFVHGSADYNGLNSDSMTTHYNDLYNYLRDNGYAIFDCYGWGNFLSSGESTYGTNMNNNAYQSGIEHFAELFNVDTNRIYMLGKSLGGVQELAMLYQDRIKLNAVGFLAPALSAFHVGFAHSANERNAIVTDQGWTEPPEDLFDNEFTPSNLTYRNYFLENLDKILQYEPYWKGLLLTKDVKFDNTIVHVDNTTVDYTNVMRTSKFIPTKFWYALDDINVSPHRIASLIYTLQNTGCICEEHVLPNNTGAHHAVDTDENALKVENVTTSLGITYESVPLAYYEFIEFISQF